MTHTHEMTMQKEQIQTGVERMRKVVDKFWA